MSEKLLLSLNKLFPLPLHPFNLQNSGVKTYAMWQYEKGADTIKFYLNSSVVDDIQSMFKDKRILDIGCGEAGKTMYYGKQGAASITGMDIVSDYKEKAEKLAVDLGLSDIFTFVSGDASKMSFPDESFDVIIMNDAMEHVADPEGVLKEVYRVLKKGGRLYVNFPPYYHPFGAHLSDVIGIPWVHMFFGEQTLIKGYKELVKPLPDKDMRINFRISTNEKG
ncbi:MAG: class I SAM-dependent methyltransferase, partial [Bacillota bacterium]|nr:class I SAM-dependent methyltransferase [Bacillota bacterium]